MTSVVEILDVCDLREPLPRGSTLIEASAGTGKTYTVAALVLRLILEQGVGIGEILVTTFTKAATAELRGRIRQLLRDARDVLGGAETGDPYLRAVAECYSAEAEMLRDRLTQALHAFDESAIFTIHGFCQRMLQDRAFESGAAFGQEFIADERHLLEEVAIDYWRRCFYNCEAYLAAAATAGRLSHGNLIGLLRQRIEHPLADFIPEGSPGELQEIRAEIQAIFFRLREYWQRDSEKIRQMFAEDSRWGKGKYGDSDAMTALLDDAQNCFEENSNMAGFPSLFVFATSALDAGRNKTRNLPAPTHSFFSGCEELIAITERYVMALQQDFLRWAPPELQRRKARLKVLSYSDLLTQLHSALHGPSKEALAAAIRTRFRAALIDEFQDTDALQEEIFRTVFGHGESWLFLIGDPKQAIYGFRSADVFTYLRAAEQAGRRYTLGTNFRSATPLVAATNHLFARVDQPFVIPGIDFHPAQASGRADAETFVDADGTKPAPLCLWAWPSVESESNTETKQKLLTALAVEIARLLHGPAKLGTRRIVPTDIAVLTLTNEEAQLTQAALREVGIAAALQSNARVFDSEEAAALLSFLTATEHPRDEKKLRAALLTDLFGFSATGLQQLAADETAWERRLLQFAAWRETWLEDGFIQMFRRALLEEEIRVRLLSRPDGERRLTNLLQLSEILQQSSVENRLGPTGLLKWLSEQIMGHGRPNDEDELRLERDEDAVRIVTVHRSKGLEYNIVFCPFLCGRSEDFSRRTVRFHDGAHDQRLTVDLGSPQIEEHRAIAREESLAESTRLLYVALTRAKQRCVIFWGRFYGWDQSAAAWLFHRPPNVAPGNAFVALKEHAKTLPEAAWRADLDALAAGSQGNISIFEPQTVSTSTSSAAPSPTPDLTARAFTADIERDWIVSSFSSLAASQDSESPDHDPVVPADVDPLAAPEIPAHGIHAFPAGKKAGVCLHEILQEADFCDLTQLGALVFKKLSAFSFDPDLWKGPVIECLTRTLSMTLPPGFALCDVPASARLAELEFYLPAARLDAPYLRQLLQDEGSQRLDFTPRRGWLKGYIDLVFAHDGRFYLADWKSNRLGSHTGAYGPGVLDAAMASHHYTLQLHLYTLALHRYLRWRLPDYDFDRHFGGVFYFFLRGLEPDQPELGLVTRRPSRATIEALDLWLSTAS